MADEEIQSDGQELPESANVAADKFAGQPTLHDIIAQQVEELRAKLGPEAGLPDATRLPQASAPGPAPPGADAQAPAEEQEVPEPAAATPDDEADQGEPAEGQASENATPDEAHDLGDGEEVDEGREGESTGAKLSLAEIIKNQSAQLREKLVADASETPADETDEEVEDGEAAEEDAEEAADVSAQAPDEAEAQQADVEQADVEQADVEQADVEQADAEQEDESPGSAEEDDSEQSETQQTLAQIIAAQRGKLQAKMKSNPDEDSPAESAEAGEASAPEVQTTSAPSDDRAAPSDGRAAPSDDRAAPTRRAQRPAKAAAPVAQTTAPASRKRRLSLMTLFVGLNTILIGVVTSAVLWFVLSPPRGGTTSPNDGTSQTTRPNVTPPEVAPPFPPGEILGGKPRREADVLFENRKFRAAGRRYGTLMRQAALRPADALTHDLCATRYARCMIELGQIKLAREALDQAPRSESPILRGYAHHMLAVLDHHDGSYMSARRHAYAAIGALGAMAQRHGMVRDCEYVAARAMSARAVANGTEKMDLSLKDLLCNDPMLGTNDLTLPKLLGDGVEVLTKAGLDPTVDQFPEGPLGRRWMVAWAGPPVEQFLQKVATLGGQDIRWGTTEEMMRRRGVTAVFRNGVSQQRLTEVACGMVGLMARFVENDIVIANPRQSESMKIRIGLLGREAVSMWRRYILADKVNERNDTRIAAGQYSLGRVHESMGNLAEALRTYADVFNNHDDSRAAPKALLRSAAIRQALSDYAGARKVLLRLIDLYPESGLFDQAYLNLGIATRRDALQKNANEASSGDALLDEAAQAFKRLNNVGGSREIRKRACLELAGCLYDRKEYSAAAKWATIYIGHVDLGNAREMCAGYLIQGKCATASGDLDTAAEAYYQVLGSAAETSQRQEALLELTPVLIKRRRYVGAIGALNRLDREKLSSDRTLQYLVLLSESYRKMSLPAQASAILDRKQYTIANQAVLDRVRVELARCQIQMGPRMYPSARKLLRKARDSMITRGSDTLGILIAHVELADLSLKLDETDLAIAGVQSIVAAKTCPDDLWKRARQILVAAYVREGKYAQAADALIDPNAQAKGKAEGGTNNG